VSATYAAGVDVGSTQTKAVVLGPRREIAGTAIVPTGARISEAAERAFRAALEAAHLSRESVGKICGTGYGRFKVAFGDFQATEITCHARGAHLLFPGTRTVIDMGGQDTKAIRVGPQGEVLDFCMNDKCAAGTGRFLSAAAEVTGLSLGEIGKTALEGREPVRMTSVCAVFVESDIMSYLAQGRSVPDVLAGVHQAIAARTASLVRRVGIEAEATFTGGVARNEAMVRALERALGLGLNVSEASHLCGALGAALIAVERLEAEGAAAEHPPAIERWEDGSEAA
jgi:predicted CoA-substrate-specific enzyme activase